MFEALILDMPVKAPMAEVRTISTSVTTTTTTAPAPVVMVPDNAPQNAYAEILDSEGKVVAVVYKKGAVASNNPLIAQYAMQLESAAPDVKAQTIAKDIGGTVRLK